MSAREAPKPGEMRGPFTYEEVVKRAHTFVVPTWATLERASVDLLFPITQGRTMNVIKSRFMVPKSIGILDAEGNYLGAIFNVTE